MQDSCQTDWNFWQDKINFCRTGGLSVIKLLSLFARNHRTFVRQTEIFCRTDWKFASFVRQSCSFREDCYKHNSFWIFFFFFFFFNSEWAPLKNKNKISIKQVKGLQKNFLQHFFFFFFFFCFVCLFLFCYCLVRYWSIGKTNQPKAYMSS